MRTALLTLALALIAGDLAGQSRPISEEDISRVKVQLDSTSDRMTGRWTVGTKWFVHHGLFDLYDDLDGNPSAMSLAPSSSTLLSFAIVGSPGAGRTVGAFFRYEGTGWVFLNGKMLLLVDDSLRFELAGEGIPARSEVSSCDNGDCRVKEEAIYVVPDSVLRVIAGAHSVDVRILGERRNLDRRFKKAHLALARALLSRQGSASP